MIKQMNMFENVLLILLAVLLLYVLIKNDNREQMGNTKKSKECSQTSINEGVLYWIFGSPKFVR